MISRGNPLGPELLREMAERGILSDAAIPVGPPIGSNLPEPALAPQMSPVVGQQGQPNPLLQVQQPAPEQDSGGWGILSGLGGLLGGGFSAPEGMNWKDLMFDAGVGMLAGQGDSFQKIGQGLAFARQSAAERRKQQQEQQRYEREFGLKERDADRQDALAEARLRQIEQDLATGSIMHLGNGILWNAATGERVAPELAEEVQRRAIQRAAAAAAAGRGPTKYQNAALGQDAEGNPVGLVFNPSTGQFEPRALPEGFTRFEDSALRYFNKNEEEATRYLGEDAVQADANIARYDRLLEQGEALAGPDAPMVIMRKLAEVTGYQIGPVNPDDLSSVKRMIADMSVDAAARMRGQGQITENERKLLADALANPEKMTPKAFRDTVEILKRAEERKKDQYDKWMQAPPEVRQQGIQYFRYNYLRTLNEGRGTGSGSTTSTGVKWSLED